MTNQNGESQHERREKLITAARAMLHMGYTTGDIKRHFRENYGVGYRQTHRYIRHARDRNLEHLNKTADQHLADSVADWQKMRHEAEETIRRCRRQMAEAENVQRNQSAILSSPNASEEAQIAASAAMAECRKLIDALGRQMASARITIQRTRQEMDRLLGNHAPMKVAQTTKDGRDVAKAADGPEPAEPAKTIDELAAAFRARQSGSPDDVADEPDGADANGQQLHTEN